VPAWLAERMTKLGTAIAEHILLAYGHSEFLTRLSDPFWFQALGCVMGMDWHSSGITTSVMGALKRGINPRFAELGLAVCGGRGRHSVQTPEELRKLGDQTGLDGETLARTSRLTARVDNNAIADGFQLYLHAFVIARSGEWAVIQQGMNADSRLARRYHWHSAGIRDFTCEPHTAIVGEHQGTIMNLVDAQALPAQKALLEIARQPLAAALDEVAKVGRAGSLEFGWDEAAVDEVGEMGRSEPAALKGRPLQVGTDRKLRMPAHHDVRAEDVDLKRLGAVLAVAHEQELRDFSSLLLVEGLGPRTLQSLALVAEVIHGTPTRFSDPARFSFAHGGKDGHPFPVPLKTYDETLAVLRRSLEAARVGHQEKVEGFRRLDRLTRAVEENREPHADFEAVVRHERAISRSLGGRTAFDDSGTPRRASSRQLMLFQN